MITKEEFYQLLEQFKSDDKSNHEIFQAIAAHRGVTTRTVYNWYEKYENDIQSSAETDNEGKSIFEWLSDYREEPTEVKQIEYNISLKKDALIVCMSDTHMGTKYLYKEQLAQDLKDILSHENVYIIFAGDMIDYGPDGPKDLAEDQQLRFKTQREMALSFGRTMSHRILAVCAGCHSHFTCAPTTPEEEVAALSVTKVYLKDGGFVNLTVGNQKYRIFITHKANGRRSISNPAGAILNMNRNDADFDIGIEAHRHICSVSQHLIRGKIVSVVNCGSYKGLDTYANRKGFIQKPPIIPGILISSSEKSVVVLDNWRHGLKFLKN